MKLSYYQGEQLGRDSMRSALLYFQSIKKIVLYCRVQSLNSHQNDIGIVKSLRYFGHLRQSISGMALRMKSKSLLVMLL